MRCGGCVTIMTSFLLLHLSLQQDKVAVSARGRRCGVELAQLKDQLTTLTEEGEVMRGEVLALRQSLAGLTALLTTTLPEDCSAARARGSWTNTAMIRPPGLPPHEAACQQWASGGGWTVVLARSPQPHARINFNRTWSEYKKGFGDVHGEHWIGNEVLHSLTSQANHELWVTMSDWDGNTAQAHWAHFSVGSEEDHYRLSVSEFVEVGSSAGDSLKHHHQRPFSTYDHDNDPYTDDHCAKRYGGGWWYFSCHVSHLTGAALRPRDEGHHAITWRSWRHNQGLRTVTMMIRPTEHLPPSPNLAHPTDYPTVSPGLS